MGQNKSIDLRLGITEGGTQLGMRKRKILVNMIEDFKIRIILKRIL